MTPTEEAAHAYEERFLLNQEIPILREEVDKLEAEVAKLTCEADMVPIFSDAVWSVWIIFSDPAGQSEVRVTHRIQSNTQNPE